jgi:hypothetical protein
VQVCSAKRNEMETLRNSARELEPLQRLFPWIWQSRPLRSRDNLLLSSSFFAFCC